MRGVGGYVVLPPSRLTNGTYTWQDDQGPGDAPILPIPDAIAALLTRQATQRSRVIGPEIPEGERNETLTSLAGTMRRRGMTPGAIFAALRHENRARCNPPLPDAEIQRIADSAVTWQPVSTETKAEPYHLTDTGNAARFVRDHGDVVRFDWTAGRWLVWDGKRWAPDDDGQTERLATLTVRRMYAEAATIEDKDTRKAAIRWPLSCEGDYRLRAMLRRAQSHERVVTRQDRLDRSGWLLNCSNGTLDLRTGELRAHDPADMLTKLVPVAYNPDAQAPRWERFEREISSDDAELIRFKQRAFGSALTGDCREQVIFINWGTGANGKSTELGAIREVLGPDYALRTPTKTLLVNRSEGIPNDVARLRGARFVAAFEPEGGRRLAESLIKEFTGGDPIAARFLHHEYFEFIPEFKLFLCTNHKPVIRGSDHAIWRRIRLIPYTLTLAEEDQDKTLPEKLRAEAEGILAWLVRGCLAWQAEGLGKPEAVREATASYRDEMDVLGGFLTDSCIMGPELTATASLLHTAYLTWCETNGEKPISKTALGLALQERGLTATRIRQGASVHRAWRGIGIRTE